MSVSMRLLNIAPDKAHNTTMLRHNAHRYTNNSLCVGGGVLAHTILGVDFSETTGEILWVCMGLLFMMKDLLNWI